MPVNALLGEANEKRRAALQRLARSAFQQAQPTESASTDKTNFMKTVYKEDFLMYMPKQYTPITT